MQYSNVREHLTRHSLNYKTATIGQWWPPYTQNSLTLRLHFLHPGLVNCLFHFHLSVLEWWCTDLKLGMIEDCIPHDQLPCIDYLLKGAQIGCLRVCYLLEHFWIHNPDITLTISELKWHRQCTRLSFCWAKSSLWRGTTKPLIISHWLLLCSLSALVYSLRNEWPMQNYVSVASLWEKSGCVEPISSSTLLRNVMMGCHSL